VNYSEWLTTKALEYRDDVLYFAGKNTLKISKEFGTPIYVINEQNTRIIEYITPLKQTQTYQF